MTNFNSTCSRTHIPGLFRTLLNGDERLMTWNISQKQTEDDEVSHSQASKKPDAMAAPPRAAFQHGDCMFLTGIQREGLETRPYSTST